MCFQTHFLLSKIWLASSHLGEWVMVFTDWAKRCISLEATVGRPKSQFRRTDPLWLPDRPKAAPSSSEDKSHFPWGSTQLPSGVPSGLSPLMSEPMSDERGLSQHVGLSWARKVLRPTRSLSAVPGKHLPPLVQDRFESVIVLKVIFQQLYLSSTFSLFLQLFPNLKSFAVSAMNES